MFNDAFRSPDEQRPELPPADFDFLVYSLRMQAELNLGLLMFEDSEEADPELGRHNIEMLAMLQEKTKGNLTEAEQRQLDSTVSELRLRYLDVMKSAGK